MINGCDERWSRQGVRRLQHCEMTKDHHVNSQMSMDISMEYTLPGGVCELWTSAKNLSLLRSGRRRPHRCECGADWRGFLEEDQDGICCYRSCHLLNRSYIEEKCYGRSNYILVRGLSSSGSSPSVPRGGVCPLLGPHWWSVVRHCVPRSLTREIALVRQPKEKTRNADRFHWPEEPVFFSFSQILSVCPLREEA